MKKYLIFLLLFVIYISGYSQVYNPSIHVVVNDALGQSQQAPLEGRSMYWDGGNFLYRPFASTAEVLTYLNTPASRFGSFIIVVDSGGTLLPNGHYSNGHNNFYMFADSTGNANLVKLNLFGAGGGGGSGLTLLTASNGGGQTWIITNPTTTPNISLGVTFGGDVSGSAINNVTVNAIQGHPLAYIQNYNNLTNQPFIPAQFNLIAGAGISTGGTYPNITVSSTILAPIAGTYIKLTGGGANVINLDTSNYRKVDTLIGVNDSTLQFTVNHQSYNIVLRGGTHGGGGGGGISTITASNVNGLVWTIGSPTGPTTNLSVALTNITPTTVNGLTLQANSVGFSIWGGTTPDTLNVIGKSILSGTNSGDVTLAGENYLSIAGQVLTANPVNVSGTNITGILKATSFPALTGDVTTSAGALATTIAANAVLFAKFQQIPAFSFVANSTNATANTQASYFKYGLIWQSDSVKVDTATLKSVFGSVNNNLTAGSGLLGGPYNGSAPITIKADTSLLATQYDVGLRQILNGVGFVKVSGTTVSYDNSTYFSTIGTINSNPKNANGATSTGNAWIGQTVDYTYPGFLDPAHYAFLDSSYRHLYFDSTFIHKLGVGDSLLYASGGDTINQYSFLDSAGFHHYTRSDGTKVFYSTGGSAVNSATYIIYQNGANYIATPIAGSSFATYTNTDFYTVISSAIAALTPSGTTDSVRGKIIIAINGQVLLSNQITIHGVGASSPNFQLAIWGLGTSTQITQNTSGKHAFFLDNGACVDIRNMYITAGATALSCIWTDSTGTQKKSGIENSVLDNLFMLNSNASYPALMLRNPFAVTSNYLQAFSNHGNAFIIENATTAGVQYGNSSFGFLKLAANDTANGNSALLVRSTNSYKIDHTDFKNLYIINGKYGINIADAEDLRFGAFDIENPVVIPIILGSTTTQATSHTWAKSNYFSSGTVLTASTTTPLIVLGPLAYGNSFWGIYLFPASGTPAIVSDSSTTNMANSFNDMHIESPGTANPYFARTSVGTFTYTSYVGTRGNIVAGTLNLPGVLAQGTVSDTTAYKPMAQDASGNVRKFANWVGSGGGSSTLTRQNITSGTSGTVTGGNYLVKFDFSSVAASYNLTTPASPNDQDIVDIQTGIAIAAPGAEITSFTITANSGQTLNFYAPVSAVTLYSGTHVKIRYNATGTYWDRLD